MDDVSRMFPKFVFGSFVESFGVSPSGELLGLLGGGRYLWYGRYPVLSSKRGWAVGTKANQQR
jgi:hypothetical protein